MIDLHMHSIFSDGSDTPEQLVRQAEKLNLYAIALTDHDTLASLDPLLEASRDSKVKTIGGVELSLALADRSLHLLGYLVDPTHKGLREALGNIIDGRNWRNERILEKLNDLGIDITLADIRKFAGDEVVARPHIALALLEKGVVQSNQQAFDELLASGQKAYVDRYRLSLKDGIELVREAGGVPVLAHPCLLPGDGLDALRELLTELTDYGLLGIEVYYSLHSKFELRKYKKLAEEFGLIATGGSDYHGPTVKKGIRMGTGLNDNLRVPNELADQLLDLAASNVARCTNLK